jgi:hypothetical protein
VNNGFWHGRGLPRGQILFGVCGGENPKRPGVYRFSSTCGIVVEDAHILSPDADIRGGGEHTKPRSGSTCVAVMTTNGAQCFIVGFSRSPEVDDETDDPPIVGDPDDSDTSGDKVYKTSGGASFILKRGGAVIVEGGAGVGVILNPLNNQMSLRSSNFRQNADGYLSKRGRVSPGSTEPATTHEEAFLHQVGPAYDRMRVLHGTLTGDARRQLELAAVKVVSSQEIATIKTRESYLSNGNWIGEGPKYQWGGGSADENAVLGKALVEALSTLIDIIKNLKVNTAWGPSTPPIPPTPIDLENLKSSLSDKILSTFAFFSKKPPSL